MKCDHGELDEEAERHTDWLEAGDVQHKTLTNIVVDKTLLQDMEKLTEFRHTGGNEQFHNAQLRFVPKRNHFNYEGMRARTQLASLDHNHNTLREQATTKTGELRWKVVFPKAKRAWVAKAIYQQKTSEYLHELMEVVYETKQ